MPEITEHSGDSLVSKKNQPDTLEAGLVLF